MLSATPLRPSGLLKRGALPLGHAFQRRIFGLHCSTIVMSDLDDRKYLSLPSKHGGLKQYADSSLYQGSLVY